MLLKAGLNGGTTRSAHPSVPQTPAENRELVRAAARLAGEG